MNALYRCAVLLLCAGGVLSAPDGGCLDLTPMNGADPSRFDDGGRWISAKHSGQVPFCTVFDTQHAEDELSCTIGVYEHTASNETRAPKYVCSQKAQCTGPNLFENPPNTKVTFTLLATNDYQTWTLFHQCAAIEQADGTVVHGNYALVVVKDGPDGAIGTAALDAEITKVLRKNENWPKKFKEIVKDMTYVAGEDQLCTDTKA